MPDSVTFDLPAASLPRLFAAFLKGIAAMDSARLQALAAAVEAQPTVIGGVETLVTGFVAELQALRAEVAQGKADQAATDAALGRMADTVQANSARLATLVTANTPAAPTEPAPVEAPVEVVPAPAPTPATSEGGDTVPVIDAPSPTPAEPAPVDTAPVIETPVDTAPVETPMETAPTDGAAPAVVPPADGTEPAPAV